MIFLFLLVFFYGLRHLKTRQAITRKCAELSFRTMSDACCTKHGGGPVRSEKRKETVKTEKVIQQFKLREDPKNAVGK
jgi:hypothetical protein